jgi:hypothetical protein
MRSRVPITIAGSMLRGHGTAPLFLTLVEVGGVKINSHKASGSVTLSLPAPALPAVLSLPDRSSRIRSREIPRSRLADTRRVPLRQQSRLQHPWSCIMRAEYRGLAYNPPTYNLASLDGTDRIAHRATLSVEYLPSERIPRPRFLTGAQGKRGRRARHYPGRDTTNDQRQGESYRGCTSEVAPRARTDSDE